MRNETQYLLRKLNDDYNNIIVIMQMPLMVLEMVVLVAIQCTIMESMSIPLSLDFRLMVITISLVWQL